MLFLKVLFRVTKGKTYLIHLSTGEDTRSRRELTALHLVILLFQQLVAIAQSRNHSRWKKTCKSMGSKYLMASTSGRSILAHQILCQSTLRLEWQGRVHTGTSFKARLKHNIEIQVTWTLKIMVRAILTLRFIANKSPASMQDLDQQALAREHRTPHLLANLKRGRSSNKLWEMLKAKRKLY